MTPFVKRLVLGAGLGLLALHVVLLLVYADPYPKNEGTLAAVANRYCYPYFHQNWNLFAPAPDCNYRLFVRYEDHGWQQKDIFGEMLARHQANRLAGYEPLVVAFSNSIHYFEKNTALQQPLNGPVKNDAYFSMLERAAQSYLRHTRGIEQQDLGLALTVENVQTKSRRVYFNSFFVP